MKIQRLTTLTILLLLMAATSYSQSIETKRGRYYVYGHRMNASEIITLMEPYPEAHKLMRSGVAISFLSIPIIAGGSSLIVAGWMEGIDLFGVESSANYTMIGVGVGLSIVGVVMAASAKSQINEAIYLYNSSVKRGAFHSSKTNWEIKVSDTGLMMRLNF